MSAVIVDTNLLVLFLVGEIAPSKIGVHRRLKAFDLEDHARLAQEVRRFRDHVTHASVLTEASNLMGSGEQETAPGTSSCLAHYATTTAREIRVDAAVLTRDPLFYKLGLADCAVAHVAGSSVTVLTEDYRLSGVLRTRGVQAWNLRHARTPDV